MKEASKESVITPEKIMMIKPRWKSCELSSLGGHHVKSSTGQTVFLVCVWPNLTIDTPVFMHPRGRVWAGANAGDAQGEDGEESRARGQEKPEVLRGGKRM